MKAPHNSMRVVALGVAACAIAVACGREPTGASRETGGIRWSRAIAFNAEFPPGFTAFQQSAGQANQVESGATAFTKVRIILRNTDGSVALDTIVNFPPGVEELTVPLSVPLPPNAPPTGVTLGLTLNYQNAAGQTVFTGGPVSVNAVPAIPGAAPPPAAPVDVPLTYTGVGSTAAGVRITPKNITVKTGEAFSVRAVAVDAGGTVIPNTPIVFVSEDGVLAQVNAATGVGSAGSKRGATRVVARLLTHQEDAAILTIQSPPARIAAVSGGGQTAPVNAALTQPVTVSVTASDGGPAPGVGVAFAAANGGSVGSETVVTGADGLASTTWRLGPSPGPQSLTASVASLTGSPVSFLATGRSVEPVRLTFTRHPPTASVAGAALAPSILVSALDAAGDVAKTFVGEVTLALGDGASAAASLHGTRSAIAIDGVATFTDLSLRLPGAYTLAASSGSLAGAASTGLSVAHGPAARLTFQNYPVAGANAGALLDPVTVIVRDDFGNTATSFTGSLTLTLGGSSSIRADSALGAAATQEGAGAALADLSVTTNAVAGVATFTGLRLTTAAGSQFSASSPGLSPATGPAFQVQAGAPSALTLVSGGHQGGPGAAALAAPIIVKVVDAFGNSVPGVMVSFAAPTGSGSATPATQATTVAGTAQTSWTLGSAAGPMTLAVSAAGVTGAPLVIAATSTRAAGPGPATQLTFTTQPSTSAAGVPMTNVVVTARDASGAVATAYTEFVNLTLGNNPSAATIVTGTTRVAAIAGVATFTGLSLNKVGAGYTLSARTEGLPSTTSTAFNVTPGTAAAIAPDSGGGQSGTVGTALANPFVARVTDQFGNPVPGATVSWNVSAGTLGLVTTTTDANGRVRALLTLGAAAGQVTTSVAATIGELAPAVFTATALSGDATQLIFTTLPSESQAGATFTPGVVVTARDANGNTVTAFTGTVSLSLDIGGGSASIVSEGGPTLAGTTSVAAVAGVATFNTLSMTKAASGYAIVATSGALSARSGKFRIKAGPARRLAADDGQGQLNTVGRKLGKRFVIRTSDAFDNAASGAPVSWTNVTGNGVIEEQLLLTDSTGRASARLTLGNGAGKHRVSASVEGVEDPPVLFEANAIAGPARKLRATGGPAHGSRVKAGAHFLPALRIEALDSLGNVDSSFTGLVSLGLATNPGADTAVAGNRSVNAVGGVATFSNANLRRIGAGYRVRAAGGGLAADSTGLFTIESGPAKRVVADSGHGQTSTVGKRLGKKFVIRATDEFDNPASGAPVTWTNISGGGAIEEQSATTDESGRARAALKLGNGAGKHRVSAGIAGADDPAIVFEASAVADRARKLVVTGGPAHGSKVKAGAHLPALRIEARDSLGNVDSTFTGLVSLSFASNPGADTAIAGNRSASAVGGIATFSNANIRKVGGGYRLRASGSDLDNDSTAAFEIESGPAKRVLADSGHGQSNTVGQKLGRKLVIRATDEFGNPASGAPVTWTNVTGSGAIEDKSATTDGNGRARASLKLGNGAGKHRISAAIAGADDPPVVFEANAVAGQAKKLRVTSGPSSGANLTAGAGLSIRVEALDSLGNVDSTFSGPVSLRFAANPGADTAVAGGNSANASGGIAVFSAANVRKAGTGYRLRATGASLAADSTPVFNIVPGQATKIAIDSGNGQHGNSGQNLNKPFVVQVTDDFDNAVAGAEVVWTVETGGGAVSETKVVTDSKGKARVSLTLGNAGGQKVKAKIAGSSNVVEFDATATGGAALQSSP